MSQIRHLRRPLLIAVVAEALLVAACLGVGWHIWQSRLGSPPAADGGPSPVRSSDPSRLPTPHASPPASRPATPASVPAGPVPGIRTDPAFLERQLRDLNRDQASLEDTEWRVIMAAIEAMRAYLERVVLPAVERAQRSRR